MKISAKTEYACIAILELAGHFQSGEPVQIRRITERHGIPPRFLVQILLQLKGAGLVTSVRGAAGGYRLIHPPEEVTLGQVMDVIDGRREEEESTNATLMHSPVARVLASAWREISAVERRMLETISLADLVEKARGQGEQMYYI